ncbi:MAG TPA: translocated intimin receptor Tir [Terriglobia bacterium]|nr:translocated intimin receptor Tir [Terriglobia bacterium]
MKPGLLKCILTDSHFWAPVVVMLIGLALLVVLR